MKINDVNSLSYKSKHDEIMKLTEKEIKLLDELSTIAVQKVQIFFDEGFIDDLYAGEVVQIIGNYSNYVEMKINHDVDVNLFNSDVNIKTTPFI
jgi:hypothetical protein